ncbi:MAG: AAA family ATPase [Dehalococcoidales bacterium]|nr:AAA family ATPase [Dehalococcoidales bacterium]
MMKVVAIVGMAGAGKSEVARQFEKSGYVRIRFGDITDGEVKKRGLELNEANERTVREQLRKEHGMAAYAKLNLPRIDEALKKSNVVVDGLYSWEEFVLLKNYYGAQLQLVAVWSSPKTRYARLARRQIRSLTNQEAAERDRTEIENINKGGPIAVADFTITNESALQTLKEQTKQIIMRLT